MPSGQEMDWAYSITVPGTHTGQECWSKFGLMPLPMPPVTHTVLNPIKPRFTGWETLEVNQLGDP